jgi:hypothetical protein
MYPTGNKKSKGGFGKLETETGAAGRGVTLKKCHVGRGYLPTAADLPAADLADLHELP